MRNRLMYRKAQIGMPILTTPNASYNDVMSGGSQGSSNNYGLSFPSTTTTTTTTTNSSKLSQDKKIGIAGAAMGALGTVMGAITPLIQNAEQKKADRKMNTRLEGQGLKTNAGMNEFAGQTSATINALNQQSMGSLFGRKGAEVKTTTTMKGILYKKAQKGASTSNYKDKLTAKAEALREQENKMQKRKSKQGINNEDSGVAKKRRFIPGPKGGF